MPENSDIAFFELQMHECETVLQYEFSDRDLLRQCLTHASVAPTRLASNERLEFLGDAILGIIVCEMLFHQFPQQAEGEMTRLKSMLVSRQTCADISTRLGLDQNLLVGKGVSASGKMPGSIKAAVLEALIAGVYLDGGFEAVRPVVQRLIAPELERVTRSDHITNYKSLLQQLTQKTSGETPVYRVVDEKGPDHSKCFQVSAVIGPKTYPAAWGPNKKAAEQNAAQNAMRVIRGKDFVNQSK
jgi:ribonuclease-3